MATLTDLRTSQASPRLGAEISGVDLTHPVDGSTARALRQAFTHYKVLVFRDQHLTPDQQVEAAVGCPSVAVDLPGHGRSALPTAPGRGTRPTTAS